MTEGRSAAPGHVKRRQDWQTGKIKESEGSQDRQTDQSEGGDVRGGGRYPGEG